jgi:hypothetical protein
MSLARDGLKGAYACLWCLLPLAPSLPAAQPPSPVPVKLSLGDPQVDGSFLKPYKNVWKVTYAFPGKEAFLVGTWTDELSAIELNGRHLLKRTQVANYAKYGLATTNINVFDPKTMSPVRVEFRRSDTGEWAQREFNGATVTYRRRKSGEDTKDDTGQLKMEEPVFDYNGGMYGVLLAAFPLEEGLTATFPTLSEDRDEFERLTYTVRKEEMVDAGPGKQALAWPVEIDDSAKNPQGSHSIFWISKEPPYVIKLITIIPSGRWVTVTMSMI